MIKHYMIGSSKEWYQRLVKNGIKPEIVQLTSVTPKLILRHRGSLYVQLPGQEIPPHFWHNKLDITHIFTACIIFY